MRRKLQVNQLTDNQIGALFVIREHLSRHGRGPTRLYIARKMGWLWPNQAEEVVRKLVKVGAIRVVANRAGGIELAAP